MSKKFIKKFFFSVRPNNLNWETLNKNLVIFLKDGIGLWWKFLILWGFTEKSDFYGGFTKKQYVAGNYLKSRPVQFADLT